MRDRNLLVAILLSAILVTFQNCTHSTFGHEGQDSTRQESGGNYDGKVFTYSDAANPCPDGNPIITQITQFPTQFRLDRDQCVTIPGGKVIASSAITYDPSNPDTLIYNSETLVAATPTPPQPAILKMECDPQLPNPLGTVSAVYFTDGNGLLVGQFTVINTSTNQTNVYTIPMQVSPPIVPGETLDANDGSQDYSLLARDPNGLATLLFVVPGMPNTQELVLCKTY